MHSLVIKQDVKLVKLNPRKMHLATSLLVKKEIEKCLKEKFIAPIDYSPWMSDVVPSQQPNGEVIVCTNFRDINKIYLKDNFHLPNIDMTTDSVVIYEISFIDGFLGYNQIKIKESEQYEISFCNPQGNFCQKVMPFGHKNVGTTYEKAMKTMFHDLIYVTIEVYVDDILVE